MLQFEIMHSDLAKSSKEQPILRRTVRQDPCMLSVHGFALANIKDRQGGAWYVAKSGYRRAMATN